MNCAQWWRWHHHRRRCRLCASTQLDTCVYATKCNCHYVVVCVCAFLFHSLRCMRIGRYTRMWMRCTWTWVLLFELSSFSLMLCVFFSRIIFLCSTLDYFHFVFISFSNRICAISFLFPNTITIFAILPFDFVVLFFQYYTLCAETTFYNDVLVV